MSRVRVLPILFNTEMVRAIMREVNPKTATRRVVKGFIPDDAIWGYTAFTPKGYISCRGTFADGSGEKFFRLPYQKMDILYVRETWCLRYDGEKYFYKADKNTPLEEKRLMDYDYVSWKPSIHMPKEAARIWLEVTDVRVERLQDIGLLGCKREGINMSRVGIFSRFSALWDSTLKKSDLDRCGWDANPWVFVIEFIKIDKPEPCILKGVEPAEDKRPCIGYALSDTDDEPCEMCKGCKQCAGNDEFERSEKPWGEGK